VISDHVQKIEFVFAVFEIVENLIRGAVAALINREQFLHIIDGKI
jgi:hypothetical protein